MELRELRSFCTAARLLSVSKAADQLQVGQPTVTTHIKKLEQELDMVLFDRVRRPIRLTLAVETLARLATPLLEGIDALKSSTSQAEEQGPVSVGSTHDIIPHTLLRVVTSFRSTYPHVYLRIRSASRVEVLHMVREGEVDVGIVPGPERGPDIDFQPLFTYERVVITPPGHPLLDEPLTSLDQIARWDLILMGKRTYTRQMLEAEFQRRGLSYHVLVELDSMDMIKRYVALGMGISVGPRLAIDPEDERNLGVLGLGNLLPVESAGILTRRGKNLSTPAQNFIAVTREAVARDGSLPQMREGMRPA